MLDLGAHIIYQCFQVIDIIKRKALIKDLAAAYHAECVACCKELLELQRMWEEVCILLFSNISRFSPSSGSLYHFSS